MLWIRCPLSGLDELMPTRHIRELTNHHTHIALTISCPCGGVHVYRTGRHWRANRRADAEDMVTKGAGGDRRPAR